MLLGRTTSPGSCADSMILGGATMPEAIDRTLLNRTNELDISFNKAIAKLASAPEVDMRLFFTMAHGYITNKIAENIALFSGPNALMRLNDEFATTYLNAINGKPHVGWQKAFKVCAATSKAISE